jgi:RND superfamily putative drug exporter
LLDRLARLCQRRPRGVAAAAALATALALALGASAAERLHPYSAADPGSDSSRAAARVRAAIGLDPDAGLVALVETKRPVHSDASRIRVERIADRIFLDPAVAFVTTYWSDRDATMVARDGHATFVVVHFATLSDRAQQLAAERLREKLGGEPGVSLGGEAAANADARKTVTSDLARAQLFAFPLLLLLGFWFFRGLLAAMLPLAVGAVAIAGSLAGLRILNATLPVSVFALNLVLGLALALAVDYSLVMVSRYREEIARDGPGEAALRRTIASAGRTVLFSALVIASALSSLLVFPQRFLYSMGLGGVLVALVSGAAALVFLPALLALLGERVDSLAPARLQRAAASSAHPSATGGWRRLAQLVMRRPGAVALLSGAFLIALGAPFLHARFAPADVGVLPAEAESRQVSQALADRFPPNLTQPLFVVLNRGEGEAGRFAAAVRRLPGAARVDPPIALDGRASLIRVASRSTPLSRESEDFVRAIRGIPAPSEVLVGGRAADFIDQRTGISKRLPLALFLLCATTLLAIFLMTSSVLLALKAVAMSLLSLGAAFGVLVSVFQEGRLESLLGYESPGGLELAMPLVLLAVGFGISADYGVILLSRIKEAHDAGDPDREAIAVGLERSGRILTAAALLICVALGALTTARIAFVKELGLGVALTVLIDATIVRALLVPSLMALFGRWNWWAPAPLRGLVRRRASR